MKFEKFEINHKGFDELLKSAPVKAELARRAERVAAAAGDGMETSSMIGKSRARATVITATRKAQRAEAKHRRLSRSMDAARG